MADETEKTREELIEEIESLRRELARSERSVAAGKWTLKNIFVFGRRIFLSPSLDNGLRKWLEAVQSGNVLPIDETASVLAAIIRRRMGFYIFAVLGTLGALSTTGLLIWQNTLSRQQIRQQAEQDTLSRRAQLIQVLYDKTCVNEIQQQENADGEVQEVTVETCTPVSDERSRAEAAKVFISIERNAGTIPDLSRSLLSNVNLNRANLYEVDLREADLSNANLGDADFSNANLSETDFSSANLSDADLSGADSVEANLSDANLNEADLSGADLSGADLSNADLSGASLNAVDLYDADLGNANLSGANLLAVNLYGANLSGATFSGANLYDADLGGANLFGTSLRKANLRAANLSRADLRRTDLNEADLREANFSETDLSKAGLIFDAAVYDSHTTFPVGFEIPTTMCLWKPSDPNGCF